MDSNKTGGEKLDGNYTRMLRAILNKSWRQHPTRHQLYGHIDTAIWMHYMDSNKMAGEETRRQLLKNSASNLEQVLAPTPHKTPTVRPPASYHEKYSS